MKTIKKFTAIQISSKTVNDVVEPELEFGRIGGPYYDRTTPKERFDTEDEAIEWAFKESPRSSWLILPVIEFEIPY